MKSLFRHPAILFPKWRIYSGLLIFVLTLVSLDLFGKSHFNSNPERDANPRPKLSLVSSPPCLLTLSTTSTPASCPNFNNGTATVNVVSGGVSPYSYSWVSYAAGDLDGQNGWNGGIGGFTNYTAGDADVTNSVAHSGSNSWYFKKGYNSPGQGSPFTRNVASAGAPGNGAAGNQSVIELSFKPAVLNDGSRITVYEGSVNRDERTGANLYIENIGGGMVSLYMFRSDNDGPNNDYAVQENIGTYPANVWNTVKMVTDYPATNNSDRTTWGSTKYYVNGVLVFTETSWMHWWRYQHGSAYVPGGSIKFTNNNAGAGFYIDDVSMVVNNTLTNQVVGTFSAGFEVNNQTTQTASNLTAGTYDVIVTDNNGCSAITSATVSSTNYPVHNVTTGLNYCTIQAAINDPLTVTGNVINVDAGTYAENVVLNKSITLNGAKAGVDARGRVAGAPSPATESIIAPAAGAAVDLQAGANSAVVDGFSMMATVGGTNGVVQTISSILTGVQIKNNLMKLNSSTGAVLWFNRGIVDLTVTQNEMYGGTASTQVIFFNGPQTFSGFYLTYNNIYGTGGTYGWFVDGNRNVGASATPRNPLIKGNLFQGLIAGINCGSRSIQDAQIIENTFNNNTQLGLQGGPKNTNIARNTFTGNGLYGMALTVFGSSDVTRGSLNATVQNNFFSGNGTAPGGFGDLVLSNQTVGVLNSVTITANSFLSTIAIVNNDPDGGTDVAHATCNWFGTNSPSGVAAKIVNISGAVTSFSPWVNSGTDDDLVTPGFQPLPNSCTACTVTPLLKTNINGVEVTANTNGTDATGSITACNLTNNVTFNLFSDLNSAPGNVKAYQVIVSSTNVNYGMCTNCSALLSAFTGANTTVSLINPALPGTLVIKFRAFVDAGVNNGIPDNGECTGDWIVYTITVNPSSTYYSDADNDNYYPNGASTIQACSEPDHYAPAANSGDCNDNNPNVHPGIPENCGLVGVNGVDDDCDGITDEDSTSPAITCPSNISSGCTATSCGNNVTIPHPSYTDNCNGLVTFNNPSGFFNIGTTTVVFTGSDASSNTSTCSMTVTVIDNRIPNITCPGNLTRSAATLVSNFPTLTALSDNCLLDHYEGRYKKGTTWFAWNSSTALPIPPAVIPPAGMSPLNGVYTAGAHTVQYQVFDVNGNVKVCQFTLTVTVPLEGETNGTNQTIGQTNTERAVNTDQAPALHCYPNPFRDELNIAFALPVSAHVQVSVLDVTGREIALIANADYVSGNYELPFRAELLGDGVYFVRLNVDGKNTMAKVVILK